jgi:peptidoglycan/LPS O-acetylase OafA/YrhL
MTGINIISSISRIKYRKDINGLRAIAVISVVLYHAGYESFSGGWLGVDMFFVISGFLISNIIISELNTETFSFKRFYLNRAKRILPALISTIVIAIPFSYWLLTPKSMLEFLNSAFASMFFYANYFFQNLDFYNSDPTKYMPLLHTWSLAIEEQFYLLFPLLCFVVYMTNKRIVLSFFTLLFIYSLFLNSTTGNLVKFYQLQFRAWELLLGVIVMILSQRFEIKHSGKLGIFIILFSLMYFDNQMLTVNSIEPKITITTGTALVLLSNNNFKVFSNTLNSKVFNFFGNISYSLYLFHQPFYAFILNFEKKYNRNVPDFPDIILLLFLFVISFLNWKFVEQVFLKSTIKKLVLFLIPTSFFIVLFILIGRVDDGYSDRYNYIPDEVLYYAAETNIYFTQEDVDNFNNSCNYGINKKALYIVGDSQVTNLSSTILSEYKSLSCEYKITIYATSGGRCLLSQQSDILGYVGWCTDESFKNFLNKLSSDEATVIIFGRFDTWLDPEKGGIEKKCENCDFRNNFSYRLSEVVKYSKEVIVIKPIPTYQFNVAESYLNKNYRWGENITLQRSAWLEYIQPTTDFLDKAINDEAIFIDTENTFCDEILDKCFASKNNKLYYTDDSHLTIEGSKLLIEEVINVLDE